MPYLGKLKTPIEITQELDVLSMLIDDADIAGWNNEGLPGDRMSVENATILTNCDRWPLMIDPQLQGMFFFLEVLLNESDPDETLCFERSS